MGRDGWGEVPDHAETGAPVPPWPSQPRPWAPVDPRDGHEPAQPTWYSSSGGAGTASTVVPARRNARTVAPAVVAAVVALLVALGVGLPRLLPVGSGSRTVAGSGAPVPDGASGSTAPGAGSAADREPAIAALLARRGAAVVADDAAAWRRTQTAAAKVPAFSRLKPLPVTQWVYSVHSLDPGPDGSSVVLDVGVHLRYDVDTSDAVVHERLTLRRGSSGWLVVSESTADRRAQPWDLGSITVVRGGRSLVIGIDTPASVLRRYARLADAAVPGVNAVWGTGWDQHPVLVVPHTTAQLGRALARSAASLEGYAAVTTGELPGDRGAKPALRVWTNTPGMADLSSVGREVVVRHELTHVATAAPSTPDVPLWLEEGFAEYVGYRGSGIALTDELGELVRAQRSGSAPQHLPTRRTFDGAQVDLAYEGADLACRLVAERYGQKQLVRLYRLTVAGTGTESANLEAALRSVTGSGTAAFEAAWRARLRALAS